MQTGGVMYSMPPPQQQQQAAWYADESTEATYASDMGQPINSYTLAGVNSVPRMSSHQPPTPQPAKQEATKPVDTFADLANLGKSLVTKTPAEIPPKATVNAVGGETQPITAYEKNSVKTVVHFGKDSPRPDIKVMVVSTMSTNTLPVKNLTFQAAVPKTMRVKLQPASAENLPAFNPILPAAAITQVMLLANPQKEKVRLKFKLQYKLGEQNVVDIGEISAIPS
ncbi:putative ADP-ribosylation factor-binding protein GGA1 [Apostichopus japonicus]|uniref:Putative ADP-ribosylation factor-binding protein GGA1 n=1 Tax=Stichopus japonicus TaxID=307972 RepID=A0A2G8JI96_STIJA|nr:putative ADP-ribosylation factor-binding protein GGA1 [Apostichopus japonicus]